MCLKGGNYDFSFYLYCSLCIFLFNIYDPNEGSFKTAGEAKVKVYATSSSTDESRLIKIVDKNGKDITSTSKIPGNSLKSVSFRVPVAGEYYLIAEDGGVNIYYVEVSNGVAY